MKEHIRISAASNVSEETKDKIVKAMSTMTRMDIASNVIYISILMEIKTNAFKTNVNLQKFLTFKESVKISVKHIPIMIPENAIGILVEMNF